MFSIEPHAADRSHAVVQRRKTAIPSQKKPPQQVAERRHTRRTSAHCVTAAGNVQRPLAKGFNGFNTISVGACGGLSCDSASDSVTKLLRELWFSMCWRALLSRAASVCNSASVNGSAMFIRLDSRSCVA